MLTRGGEAGIGELGLLSLLLEKNCEVCFVFWKSEMDLEVGKNGMKGISVPGAESRLTLRNPPWNVRLGLAKVDFIELAG